MPIFVHNRHLPWINFSLFYGRFRHNQKINRHDLSICNYSKTYVGVINTNKLSESKCKYLNILPKCGKRTFATHRTIAIVGAGPAGMYTAKAVMKLYPDFKVDIYEKLPVPYGLIRYGVAPDNLGVKNAINIYNKVLFDSRVRLLANVEVGKHISYKDLLKNYDVVNIAIGLDTPITPPSKLMIPRNVFIADSFVKWYNGHPQFVNELKPDLKSVKKIVVLGLGNVSLDIVRTLFTPMHVKKKYDIPAPVLEQLEDNCVSKIHIIGRKGIENVKFTSPEMRSVVNEPFISLVPYDNNYINSFNNRQISEFQRPSKILYDTLKRNSSSSNDTIHNDNLSKPLCIFDFYGEIADVFYNQKNMNLTGIKISRVLPGNKGSEIIPCEMLIFSYGYEPSMLDDIYLGEPPHIKKYDPITKTSIKFDLPAGLFISSCTSTKFGYNIASSIRAAKLTSNNIYLYTKRLEENKIPPKTGFDGCRSILTNFDSNIVDVNGWMEINKTELDCGVSLGKSREKVIKFQKMVSIAKSINS